MIDGIGDIQAALELVRKMRCETVATIEVFKKTIIAVEAATPPDLVDQLMPIAKAKSLFAKVVTEPPSSADLLTQLDEICGATQFLTLRETLNEIYEGLSGIGVNSEKTQQFRKLSERVNRIRMAQRAVDELTIAGVPAELLDKVSEALTTGPADKVDAYVQAQIVINEPGHLGERLARFLELMEKSELPKFNEHQKETVEKTLAVVDGFYEVLSHLELFRELSDLLAETVQIERLLALQTEAHRIRDMNKKLDAVGDHRDLEARLADFVAIAKLPATS